MGDAMVAPTGEDWVSNELFVWAFVSGIGAMAAVVMIGRLIFKHLENYTEPEVQTFVLRILLLVPVFAIEAWLSVVLVHTNWPYLFAVFRDGYEAYVVYLFVMLCITYMGGNDEMLYHFSTVPARRMPGILGYVIGYYRMNRKFLRRIKQCVLQFCFIKPLLALIELGLELAEYHFTGTSPLAVASVISIVIAMAALLCFYRATLESLVDHNPAQKFIAIKGVIFVAVIQGFAFNLMVNNGDIEAKYSGDEVKYTATEFAHLIQGMLVSYEMVVAAVALHSAFPYTEFSDLHIGFGHIELDPVEQPHQGILRVLNCYDFYWETRDAFCMTTDDDAEIEKPTPRRRGDSIWGRPRSSTGSHAPLSRQIV